MRLTNLQAHVLANLNRVIPIEAKISTTSSRAKYQLDDKDCTPQIISLLVQKLIGKHSSGGFRRLDYGEPRESSAGRRQTPLASSIEAIKASLRIPETVRRIGATRR